MLLLASPAVAADIPITWNVRGSCTPDTLEVSFIPPDTLSFKSTLSCGGVVCVEEWVVSHGKRIGEKSTCALSSPSSPPYP